MDEKRREIIKSTIRRIHAGEEIEALKTEFGGAVEGLTEAEIASVEEEAIKEGASVDDVRRLCGAHLEVFKASMTEKPIDVPHWHPLHIQEEEHIDMANKLALLKGQVHALLHGAAGEARAAAVDRLRELIVYFGRAESNFQKQENVYFPLLERHGIAQPPKIMWAEHDLMRAAQKRLAALSGGDVESSLGALRDTVLEYEGLLLEHIMKERSILFPASLQLFSEKEWQGARREFDSIGYFAFYPMPFGFEPSGTDAAGGNGKGAMDLDTGYLFPRGARRDAQGPAGRHHLRGRRRQGEVLQRDSRPHLRADQGRHRPLGPKLPSAQEPQSRAGDPGRLPRGEEGPRGFLAETRRQVRPYPLLRGAGRGRRLPRNSRGQPGHRADPSHRGRKEAESRLKALTQP